MQYKLAKLAGLNLKKVRIARQMTQQELADYLHCEERTIRRYEQSGINSLATLEYIASVLDVDLIATFLS